MARDEFNPVAEEIPFDNENTDFDADNVQAAIEEIGASASPGFSWGRAGNNTSGTWLLNEGVPSNRSGRLVFINNPVLAQIFTASEDLATYTLTVYEHEGDEINLTVIDTLNVTNARGASKVSTVSLTPGRQIAVRITSGSARNIIVGAIIKGTE